MKRDITIGMLQMWTTSKFREVEARGAPETIRLQKTGGVEAPGICNWACTELGPGLAGDSLCPGMQGASRKQAVDERAQGFDVDLSVRGAAARIGHGEIPAKKP